MEARNFFSFLGLCQRAGKLVSGEFSVNNEIKKGKLKLIIIAEDSSPNTKDTYITQAKNKGIPYLIIGDKETLGSSIGKEYRALIGVKDKNMATNLIKIIENK